MNRFVQLVTVNEKLFVVGKEQGREATEYKVVVMETKQPCFFGIKFNATL